MRAAGALKGNRDWEISSGYYSMYFALYAILMKIGVKCENHSCTIEFMRDFLSKHFSDEELRLIKNSMILRIDAQYYTNKNIPENKYRIMINNAPAFLAKCKDVINRLKEEEIIDIRKRLKGIQNG